MITIEFSQVELQARLGDILGRLRDGRPAWERIGELLRNSIRENFLAGGRPEAWPPSRRALAQRGQTLLDTGLLYNSFTPVAQPNGVAVGTNVVYAAAHNFGLNKVVSQQVRPHLRRIVQAFGTPLAGGMAEVKVGGFTRQAHLRLPARPFMMIQNDDWLDFQDVLSAYLQTGTT